MKYSILNREPAVDIRDVRVFRTENFAHSAQIPWLDRPDWRESVDVLQCCGDIDSEQATLCTQWAEHGYVIIPGTFAADQLDAGWQRCEESIVAGTLTPTEDYGASSDYGFDPYDHVSAGYLAANWIAPEDISPDSGSLEYCPGSHRLAYAYTRGCGISLTRAGAVMRPTMPNTKPSRSA